jgi:hypothetical protein
MPNLIKHNFKNLLTTCILVFGLLSISFGQFQQETIEIIKGRRVIILEHFQADNFKHTKVNATIGDYYVLLMEEQKLLYLIQENFKGFLKVVTDDEDLVLSTQDYEEYHELKRSTAYAPLYNRGEEIREILERKLLESKLVILNALETADLRDFQRDFIKFYIARLDFKTNHEFENEKQLEMHKMALRYVDAYPKSGYSRIVKEAHGRFSEPSWFAMDFNIAFGMGLNTGAFGENATRPFGFDLDVKMYFHSTFIGVRGDVTFNKVKTNLQIDEIYISENQKGFFLTYYDFYIGRKFDFLGLFSLLPMLGYSIIEQYDYVSTGPETFDIKNNYFSSWHYGFDFNYNFRKQERQNTYFAKHKRNLSHHVGYFRLSVVYHDPQVGRYVDGLSGNTWGFYLGVGAHLRAFKNTTVPKQSL